MLPDLDPFAFPENLDGVAIAGVEVRSGDRVRLAPQGSADVFDLALTGRTATVESIEQDFENQIYVTVTLEDDPGQDLGRAKQPGHRFFFRVEEIQTLPREEPS